MVPGLGPGQQGLEHMSPDCEENSFNKVLIWSARKQYRPHQPEKDMQGCQSDLVKNGTKKGKKQKNGLKMDLTLLQCTVLYCTVLYYTVLYSTVQWLKVSQRGR